MTRSVLALLLTAALVAWNPPVPAGDGLVLEPFLRIRVREAAGETVADVPRKLLDALGPTGAPFPWGLGRDARFVSPLTGSFGTSRRSRPRALRRWSCNDRQTPAP